MGPCLTVWEGESMTNHHWRKHGSRQADRHGAGAGAAGFYLIHKQEVVQRELTGNGWVFEISKPRPSVTHLSNRHTPPNLSQTVPPAGDQTFKLKPLGGHSHPNHHTLLGSMQWSLIIGLLCISVISDTWYFFTYFLAIWISSSPPPPPPLLFFHMWFLCVLCTLHPNTREAEAVCESQSSRPAWFIVWVPGWAGLHKETLVSKKQKQKQSFI